ncbi:MAG: T9SS type A sorting domain-containing protein, partial [Thermonemataceae bacterium]|nr:T9SS type A sorting domain-containing protein [Thermonemataceae bacterium]
MVTFNQIVNKVSVKITDMQGRILETKEQQLNEKKLAINTELAVGMYVLHLEVDGKTFAQKIIVAK